MSQTNSTTATQQATSPGKVPVNTSFSKSIYKRLEKYTSEKGLDRVQDAVRVAVAKFLDSEGY